MRTIDKNKNSIAMFFTARKCPSGVARISLKIADLRTRIRIPARAPACTALPLLASMAHPNIREIAYTCGCIRMPVRIKRVYDEPGRSDGYRILVDRLWPRGLSKEKASVDEWLRDIAPSDELRKWFSHDRERWEEFRTRYWRELETKGALVEAIRARARKGVVTLLYSTRETVANNAAALKEFLERTGASGRKEK
jgi:uncharacterized protein YeaO (DUF488 family)